jgi:hypothetical protein
MLIHDELVYRAVRNRSYNSSKTLSPSAPMGTSKDQLFWNETLNPLQFDASKSPLTPPLSSSETARRCDSELSREVVVELALGRDVFNHPREFCPYSDTFATKLRITSAETLRVDQNRDDALARKRETPSRRTSFFAAAESAPRIMLIDTVRTTGTGEEGGGGRVGGGSASEKHCSQVAQR